MSTSNLKKTIKFIERHLDLLPSHQQSHDVNKFALIFYSIVSLSVLNKDVTTKYHKYAQWIRNHYIRVTIDSDDKTIGGFVGSLTFKTPNVTTINLPNTLFALVTLLVIGDETIFANDDIKNEIRGFVSRCQIKTRGGFVSTLDYHTSKPSPIDPHDLRFAYIAVAILYILGCRSDKDFNKFIDVDKLLAFITAQQCDSGAYGEENEPHAGYTSCAISTLYILQKLDTLSPRFKEKTIEWLIKRQVSNEGCMKLQDRSNENYDLIDHGGFQGRENKFADTCYAFWCLNSLKLLCGDSWKHLINYELVEKYLADVTQNELIGGYQKNNETDPDLYHTCLGIAAMQLIHDNFNGALFIPAKVALKYNL